MLKKIISVILASALCFGLCACGGSDTKEETSVSQSETSSSQSETSADQEDTKNIFLVTKAVNNDYPGNITYGDAFKTFFSGAKWRYFKGTQEGPDDNEDGEPDYTIDDIDVVEFSGKCMYQDVEVTALIQFTLDKEAGTFEASYLSFNDVPQSTAMLSGLIDNAFESYMEENNIQSDDYDGDITPDTSVDDYDYEALNYAGEYESEFEDGYKIIFNAYSSVDSDVIGTVEIYNNDSLEYQGDVCICNDSGDWDASDYDAFYSIPMDGYDYYLGFSESNGEVMLDYNGNSHNITSLIMTRHYQS
ncbi:hypothetical protein [Eubacterium ramulus]